MRKASVAFLFLLLAALVFCQEGTTGGDVHSSGAGSVTQGGSTSGSVPDATTSGELGDTGGVAPEIRVPTETDPRESILTIPEFQLAGVVLLFGLFCMGFVHATFRHTRDKTLYVRLASSVVIITAILFLIAANVRGEAAAPAYGLLGTVAGYILGRTTGGSQPDPRSNRDDPRSGDAQP